MTSTLTLARSTRYAVGWAKGLTASSGRESTGRFSIGGILSPVFLLVNQTIRIDWLDNVLKINLTNPSSGYLLVLAAGRLPIG